MAHRFTDEQRDKGKKARAEKSALRVAEKKPTFLKVLEARDGNVKKACAALRMSRQTYYSWRDGDPVFAENVKDVFEGVKDTLEARLITIAAGGKGNFGAACAYLNARAKDRGYGIERKEHTGPGGGSIQHRVDLTNKTDDEIRAIMRDEIRKRQGLKSA